MNNSNSSKKNNKNTRKKIDLEFPKIPKYIQKNKTPLKKLVLRNSKINKNNEISIKVNKSNYLVSNKKEKSEQSLIKKMLKSNMNKKMKCGELSNNKHRNKKIEESPNKKINKTAVKNKEFNKIFLLNSLNEIKITKKKSFKINIKNINKVLIKNKSTEKKTSRNKKIIRDKNISDESNLNNLINFNKTERTFEKDSKFLISSKFIKAQEKWKRNYFATIIQKIYKGYIFRKIFMKNMKNKLQLHIYIKKIPKYKSFYNKNIKLKNKNIDKIEKSNKLINQTNEEYFYNRNYSTKQFKKIKEIIIKKRNNSPLINLNLNNCCLYGYNNNYINYNRIMTENDIKSTTFRNNNNRIKYWENIKVLIKLKKCLNHWDEITLKNKIIKFFIKIRKNLNKNKDINNNLKGDETYNTTNSFSDEKKNIINFSKNTKLFYFKK